METFEIVPDALAYGGSAVGTLPSGKRCFIRGGVPGDRLLVEIVSEKKSFASARIVKILSPSPDRIEPECPHAKSGLCMGCAYASVRYETELEWKQKQLERFLVHSGLASTAEEPQKAPGRTGWRNKIRLTADKKNGTVRTGYLMEDNETVLPVKDCKLARPELAEKIRGTLQDPAFTGELPEGRSRRTFRWTGRDGALMLESGEGPEFLTDEIPGFGEFTVPRTGFFQINTEAAGGLLRHIAGIIRELKPFSMQEFYCGCGVFSALAAENGVRKIFGVELDRNAIECAKENLSGRGFPRCRFLAGDVLKTFGELPPAGPDTLILIDPPRTGMERAVAEKLAASRAGAMIYVSCGPDTLSRDLKILSAGGWKVERAKLFDLFPSTAHFETAVLLRKDAE